MTMRLPAPVMTVISAGTLCIAAVYAQSSTGSRDLSGVYAPPVFVGVPAVTEPAQYPFMPEAQRIFDAFDPIVDDARSIDDCVADGVPGVFWSASPMQLTIESDRVVQRYERGDTVRSIPFSEVPPASGQARSRYGDSVARWEGDVLVIETANMEAEYLRTLNGHPLSGQGRITERYTRVPGSMDLRLEVVVNDPVYYTAQFTLGRDWVWDPSEEIMPFDCVSLGPPNEEPDIDEIARMLESME